MHRVSVSVLCNYSIPLLELKSKTYIFRFINFDAYIVNFFVNENMCVIMFLNSLKLVGFIVGI